MSKKEEIESNMEKITRVKEKKEVPFNVYENERNIHERASSKKDCIIIILVLTLLVSNLFWGFIYNEQDKRHTAFLDEYEFVVYDQNGEGLNNINLGTQGDINGTETCNYEKEER